MCREADRRGTLKVQYADPGRQRYGNDPFYTRPSYPIIEDALQRPIQYRITGVDEFAGREYKECLEHVFEVGGPDPALGRIHPEVVVRVFTPGVVVALHGDPDAKLVSTIAGETIWWARPPDAMTVDEHERLLRGQFFLQWRDWDDVQMRIPPGTGFYLPSRWAHWLEHPGDVPVVSFEVGFWTAESLNARKVYDVNWLLRKAGIDPDPPGGPRRCCEAEGVRRDQHAHAQGHQVPGSLSGGGRGSPGSPRGCPRTRPRHPRRTEHRPDARACRASRRGSVEGCEGVGSQDTLRRRPHDPPRPGGRLRGLRGRSRRLACRPSRRRDPRDHRLERRGDAPKPRAHRAVLGAGARSP